MMSSKPINAYLLSDRLRMMESQSPNLSFKSLACIVSFWLGFVLFLVAFSSSEWFGIENGITVSLWQKCSQNFKTSIWSCEYWEDKLPDFIRAGQGFCIVGLLTYVIAAVIIISYIFIRQLQETRALIIALCLLIFSAGCMTIMASIVVGVKGGDFCYDIKRDRRKLFDYFIAGVDASGKFSVGWSFIVAILSAITTLVSFTFCMLEFFRVNAMTLSEPLNHHISIF
ncbi:hypothetical protein LOTGIDRAFT_227858 [Lottia gigantea]|uniref:MARVEL domain-containing protein n=1 Tax=Lottia gigantea TaxID=225164 RepID=V4CRN7_LOTGI|nr:hypothetical protein LOTGIDRAFT_227858 [Lottia gigantea]ESP05185.1 hypothetical protein LOTGIDRAFT_227858 [Lottia gigantea]